MKTGKRPARSEFARHWLLEERTVFLNHGSFGACPRGVLETHIALRERMEREPIRFFVEDLDGLLDEARGELARFVGADPEGMVFVANATTGVNTVVRSLEFAPGDDLLTNNHEYNACNNALRYVAERSRARVVTATVPFPVKSDDEIVAAIVGAATPRTRLALVSHVTSPTGLIFPIERIVKELAERGIDTIVDGAHAPGMVPLSIERVGAAYYTGNCHKWLCAPKGAGFLWMRADKRGLIRPLVISHGANSTRTDRARLMLEFDYTGTGDMTPYLCVPEAIRFVGGLLPGGWPEVMRRNRNVALAARGVLCKRLGAAVCAPDHMFGSMAAVSIPDRPRGHARPTNYHDALQDALIARHGVQAPINVFPAPPRRLVRISAQMYNSAAEYEFLADALAEELKNEGRAAGGD